MATAVMACMRNEALFVTEWVAYHRLIGFNHVLVATNDCTDGTDLILDRLQALGQVHHIRNDDLGGLAPQPAGVLKVLARAEVQRADWLLHIDSDEFLNIQHGGGHILDLTRRVEDFDAVGLAWRLFGTSGLTEWPGGLVTERLVMAEGVQAHFAAMQKTMFRPARFRAGIDHMPKLPVAPGLRLGNARGMALNAEPLYDPATSDLRVAWGREVNRKRLFGWDGAYVNHYAVRTPDLFLLKNVRGDGVGSRFAKRYHLNSRWYRAANRNEVQDVSILRHLDGLRRILGLLRQDRELVALETEAMARVQTMKATHLTPDNIRAWTNPRGAAAVA